MDMDVIKLLLETKNNAYKSSLQIFMEQITSMNLLRLDLQELKDNFRFMEQSVDTIRQDQKDCKRECGVGRARIAQLEDRVKASNASIAVLATRCNDLDDQSRRNNLVIGGIQEDAWETPEQTSTKLYSFLEEKMQLPDVILEEARLVGWIGTRFSEVAGCSRDREFTSLRIFVLNQ